MRYLFVFDSVRAFFFFFFFFFFFLLGREAHRSENFASIL